MTKLHRGMLANNTDVISSKAYSTEPTEKQDGVSIAAGDIAYSDGTSSTNNFGVNGKGAYVFNGTEWQYLGSRFASGGTVAASSGVITVKHGYRYQLTASDTITGITGLADGEFCQVIAPSSGSTTLTDGGSPASGQALALGGNNLTLNYGDESTYILTRIGTTIRVSGGSGGGIGIIISSRQVSATNLADSSHAINTSGKILGAMALDTTNNRIYFSLGSNTTSSWRPLDDQSGTSDVTPS